MIIEIDFNEPVIRSVFVSQRVSHVRIASDVSVDISRFFDNIDKLERSGDWQFQFGHRPNHISVLSGKDVQVLTSLVNKELHSIRMCMFNQVQSRYWTHMNRCL